MLKPELWRITPTSSNSHSLEDCREGIFRAGVFLELGFSFKVATLFLGICEGYTCRIFKGHILHFDEYNLNNNLIKLLQSRRE